MKKKHEWPDDDGRTVADMSEVRRGGLILPRRLPSSSKPQPPATPVEPSETSEPLPPLSREDRRLYIGAALKAALLIAAVFIVGLGLAIALMLLVWTR